jgi:hypothetical protein
VGCKTCCVSLLPSFRGEDWLLERVTAAAEERQFSQNTKAALALLYHVLGSTNPFAECAAPKFAPEKIELRYHTAAQLGQLLHELREDRRSYFGYLTYHLATALFFTGCRFHEWARLTLERLVREPGGMIIAARLHGRAIFFAAQLRCAHRESGGALASSWRRKTRR